MSWDVSLYKFSQKYGSLDEIPGDEQPQALGTLHEVQSSVSEVFAGTSWADPVWGIFDSDIGSIEFNVGQEEPVVSVALHVRASDAIVAGILQLCAELSCQAIDLTDSSFLEQSVNPEQGLRQWREYLHRVVQSREV